MATSMFAWKTKKFYNEKLRVGEGKTNSQKLKLFAYSMIIGLALLLTLLFALSGNPFTAFSNALKNLMDYRTNQDRLLINVAIFGLAGIAVAVGFKTGLFNMGVSGQMLFGGLLSGMIALHVGKGMPSGLGQVVVLVVAIVGAALFAGFAGILKTYFGIHEVVSTILLNWIAFLLMQAIVRNYIPDHLDSTKVNSVKFGENFTFTYKSGFLVLGGWIAITLLVATALVTWVLIYKTSFGHKMVIVGKNKEAALASGINVKMVSVFSMMISGAIAGVLSVVVFFINKRNLTSSLVDAVPTEGFDGIAIAILAFSNPVATIPVAFIFAFIQSLITNTSQIDNTFVSLVTGVLMLCAALNILFSRFNLRDLIIRIFLGRKKLELIRQYREKREGAYTSAYEHYEEMKLRKESSENIHRVVVEKNVLELKKLKAQHRAALWKSSKAVETKKTVKEESKVEVNKQAVKPVAKVTTTKKPAVKKATAKPVVKKATVAKTTATKKTTVKKAVVAKKATPAKKPVVKSTNKSKGGK